MSDTRIPRKDVPIADTWQLEDIYATDAAWEADAEAVKTALPLITAYEGKLSEATVLLDALTLISDTDRKAESLYTYARMRRDEDNQNTVYQSLCGRAQAIMTELSTATAFVTPELVAMPEAYLTEIIQNPAFERFSMMLTDLLRQKPHTLSVEAERIVAMTGDMGASPDTIYSMLSDADMRFPDVIDEDGHAHELTHASYVPLMMSRSQTVRKGAFEALYGVFKGYSATIPAIYSASVQADLFYARAANHESALAARLYPNNIPIAVYDRLVQAVRARIPSLTRYLAINQSLNHLDEMHFYDLYLAPDLGFDVKLPFDEAFDLVIDCLGVLGEPYQAVLRRAQKERWIDRYENEGKSSGAYAWGTYDSHPYVLINYKPDLDHLQTIAHEMGHAMHSYLSHEQPYEKFNYSLFVAEVASTVNEVLVLNALMDRYPDKNAQAFLLYNLLDSFRTTVFRQTQFAEFERASHEMAERGESLTVDSLNRIGGQLNRDYYPGLVYDERIAYEWMRIPHFYRSFYVYQYATGFSAAMAIAGKIRREGTPAVEAYLRFLRAGGSLYPIDALRLAGVDMATPEPVNLALDEFDRLLRRYETVVQA